VIGLKDLADPGVALALTARIIAIGEMINALEWFGLRQHLRDGSVLDWPTIRAIGFQPRRLRPFLDRFMSGDRLLGWQALRTLLAFLLFTMADDPLAVGVISLLLAAIALLSTCRIVFGADGSDAMAQHVLFGLTVAGFGESLRVTHFGLLYIALMSAVAYCGAGIPKCSGPEWKAGEAAFLVSWTELFGWPGAARQMEDWPRSRRLITRLILAWEVLFPAVFLLPLEGAATVCVLGIGFHLVNAIVMGLGGFFWAFVATYPSLMYVVTTLR
jgi:hypothetical protein